MTVDSGRGQLTTVAWVQGAPLSHASSIATDGTNVYWVPGDGTVHASPAAGGSSTTIAADPCHIADAIAVDDAYVYWSAGDVSAACPGHVARAPKAGGPVTMVASGFVFPGLGGIVVDDRSVYIVGQSFNAPLSDGSAQSAVWAIPKGGGVPVAVAGSTAQGPPAVDGSNVYWISSAPNPSFDTVTPSTIMRTPRDGGASVALATVNRNITALFYFDDRIYWVESGEHGVEYVCTDCASPAKVESMGAGDTAPVTAVTMPTGTLIIDAVADRAALWLLQEGTRSGQGVDYPPNDDHTGALWKPAPGAAITRVLGGLPFHTTLAMGDTQVFALGDTAPVVATK